MQEKNGPETWTMHRMKKTFWSKLNLLTGTQMHSSLGKANSNVNETLHPQEWPSPNDWEVQTCASNGSFLTMLMGVQHGVTTPKSQVLPTIVENGWRGPQHNIQQQRDCHTSCLVSWLWRKACVTFTFKYDARLGSLRTTFSSQKALI